MVMTVVEVINMMGVVEVVKVKSKKYCGKWSKVKVIELIS